MDLGRRFTRLAFLPVLTLTLCSFAQSPSPSGTFGFVVGVSQIDSNGDNGGALVGLITFDGAGNVTGNAIIKPRSTNAKDAQAVPSPFNGTYSSNSDGTGSVMINFDIGFSATFFFAATGGGQGLYLVGADCSPCGADVPLRVQGQGTSLAGDLPVALVFNGANGTIPLTLSNVTKDVGGPTAIVYTALGATGSGTAQCADGSAGTWTANVPVVTVVVNNGVGNFLAAIGGTVCGQLNVTNLTGLVYPSFGAGGVTNLVMHAISGDVASGTARVAGGSSLNGSYGVQLHYLPFPFGGVGVMKFDGAGNVAVTVSVVGGTLSAPSTGVFTGTYVINPDGTGTITLKNVKATPGPVYAFVITDGGTQLLLLRTDSNPLFDVGFGTGRLQ